MVAVEADIVVDTATGITGGSGVSRTVASYLDVARYPEARGTRDDSLPVHCRACFGNFRVESQMSWRDGFLDRARRSCDHLSLSSFWLIHLQ